MTEPVRTSSARLNCLCGAISLPGSVLKHPTFPIPDEVCHCNPCRYVTGGLAPTFPCLKTAPPSDVLDKLTAYKSSSRCTRYFCSKCGSHCFVEHPQAESEWYCNGGIIDPPPTVKDVVQITSHAYIDDTVDGGLAPLLLFQDNTLYPAVRRENPITSRQVCDMAKKALQHLLPKLEDKLSVKCHCGGVSLQIARADYVSNPHNVKARMIPQDSNKYIAWFCVCRSCRLATGYSLQGWAYVPMGAITSALTQQPVVFGDAAFGANEGLKLQHYRHSEEAQRSFCSGCGATVFFYYLGEDGDGVVDVSAGILRADSGVMAREWLEWKEGHMSHREEMVDQSQGECVAKGWKALGLGQ